MQVPSVNFLKSQIIRSSSKTSCQLVHYRRPYSKRLDVITTIVNSSVSTGLLPEFLKYAHVKPLPKKNGLDISDYANYRPISNLCFFGKVIERIAIGQLHSYLNENHLYSPVQ